MQIADDQTIASMYAGGMSLRDIASSLGVSKQYVDHSLRKQGIEKRSRSEAGRLPQAAIRSGRTIPAVEREIVQRYISGETIESISASMGVTDSTIYAVLHRYDVSLRGHPRKTPEDVKQRVVEMYRSGKTLRQIGDAIGMSATQARKILLQRDEPRRPVAPFHEAQENPASEEEGLVCMGRRVELELREVAIGRHSRSVKAPKDAGMLYDKAGVWWPSCSLLIAEFTRGTEEVDAGKGYFGRSAVVFQGTVDLPTQNLDAWHKLGEIDTIYYDRAGTKHPGFFKHTFNQPRGIYKLIFLVKGKAAKEPAVLYTFFNRKRDRTSYRIELPKGCVVDDRGIVLP